MTTDEALLYIYKNGCLAAYDPDLGWEVGLRLPSRDFRVLASKGGDLVGCVTMLDEAVQKARKETE